MVVRVLYEEEGGRWSADSPDIERWTVVADSFEEARRLAEEGARFALEDDTVEVEHYVPEGFVPAKR